MVVVLVWYGGEKIVWNIYIYIITGYKVINCLSIYNNTEGKGERGRITV